MFTWCRTQTEPVRCTTFSKINWPTLAHGYTPGRPRRGRNNARPTMTIWETRFGTQRGSRLWGPQWVQTRSCCEQRQPAWKRRADCGRPCHGSPDAQCAWQIRLQCAGPRCHHFLRTVSNRPSTRKAMMACGGLFWVLGRLPGSRKMAHWLTNLPMRLGWSAARMAPAAYWASWENALEMLSRLDRTDLGAGWQWQARSCSWNDLQTED